MKRLQVVDIVRALSILVVLAHHLGFFHIATPSSNPFVNYLWDKLWFNGVFGVTVFFVVSGFVITRLIASQPGGLFNPNYRDFYARRVGRIFPLLTLICLIGILMMTFFSSYSSAFVYVFKDPHTPHTPTFWLSIATFTFNWYEIFSTHGWYQISSNPQSQNMMGLHWTGLHWGVLWSLSIEEQFYLFYPWVLKRLRNKRNLILFLSVLIVSGPFMVGLFSDFFKGFHFFENNSFTNFGFIAIGCLLCLVSFEYEEFFLKNKRLCVCLCLLGILLTGTLYCHSYVEADGWWYFLAPTSIAFGIFLFLLGGLHLNFFNSKYWSFLGWIGKLSYGGYLYHSFILYLLCPFLTGKGGLVGFFILAGLTFTVSELSYRFFEVPSNLFIRKLFNR